MNIPTLEEARIKFPIGTIINNINLKCGCSNIEITGTYFKILGNQILINKSSCKRKGYGSSDFTVFSNGMWADIQTPSDVQIKEEPKYEIY